jgi:thermitase
MKKILFVFVTAITINSYGQTAADFVNNQLIVKFKSNIVNTSLRESPEEGTVFGLQQVDQLNIKNNYSGSEKIYKPYGTEELPTNMQDVYLFSFSQGQDILSLIKQYMATGLFEYVEPNHIGNGAGAENIQLTPNDQYFYPYQWGSYNDGTFSATGSPTAKAGADINMKCAWDITTGDTTTIVAIIDTGNKMDHPEFAGRIWKNRQEIAGNNTDDDSNGYKDDVQGWDFVNSDNNPADDHGHGSNCASIIGCNGNNSSMFAGINWKCKLMILKSLNASNQCTEVNVVNAIKYAADKGAKVISMSFVFSSAPTMQNALDYAYNKGVVLVAGIGNDNNGTKYLPASGNHVIAVGSISADNTRSAPFPWGTSSGSNYGNWISVVAPGNVIYSIDKSSNTGTTNFSGTSQATPHVAGVASLLFAVNPTISPDSVKKYIEKTAIDKVGRPSEDITGYDNYMGWGRVDACKALQKAKDVATGINPIALNNGAKIYPNPFSTFASISIDRNLATENDLKTILIYDMLGKQIRNLSTYSNEFILNRDGLNEGIYFYRVLADDKVIASEKFILTEK